MADHWTDFQGKVWLVTTSPRRLKFKIPCHAALRAHVFRRDKFTCVRCGAQGVKVPPDYDGRFTVSTNTLVRGRWSDVLVLDHILTLRAGGRSVVANLQTLCETCNRRKQREDKLAIAAHEGAP